MSSHYLETKWVYSITVYKEYIHRNIAKKNKYKDNILQCHHEVTKRWRVPGSNFIINDVNHYYEDL